MINFVNRLVIIIMIKADAGGVRDFSFLKNDQFRKIRPQLVTFHDKMDFISILTVNFRRIFF